MRSTCCTACWQRPGYPGGRRAKLENDPEYEGVSKRLKRLETHTKNYCEQNGLPYAPFVGGVLYDRWKRIVAGKRNRAVHAGVAGFTWNEAADAIATAKEAIIFLGQRISTLSNYFQLSPTVRGIRGSAGGILFLTPSKVSHLSRLGEQASADEIAELFIDDIHAFCVMISGKDQIRYEATRKSSSSSQMQSFF